MWPVNTGSCRTTARTVCGWTVRWRKKRFVWPVNTGSCRTKARIVCGWTRRGRLLAVNRTLPGFRSDWLSLHQLATLSVQQIRHSRQLSLAQLRSHHNQLQLANVHWQRQPCLIRTQPTSLQFQPNQTRARPIRRQCPLRCNRVQPIRRQYLLRCNRVQPVRRQCPLRCNRAQPIRRQCLLRCNRV